MGLWCSFLPLWHWFYYPSAAPVCGKNLDSGLLAAPRKSQHYINVRWGAGEERKIKKIIKALPLSPSLASKLFTKSPRLCYSVFCCVHREQVISKANQECIHYCRAAVGESNCSFHLARGFWTATIQSTWFFGKPFLHPPALSLFPYHPCWLCHAQFCFSIKDNLIHALNNVFLSIITALLCKSCFLSNKSSECF